VKIVLIAAMAKNRVIGFHNQMPWHLPADLKHFKQVTLNHPIVMGRKTFESIGRPLPNRRNIVISRQSNLKFEGVEIFNSLEAALAELHNEAEVMIIGGQTLFEQMMPVASKMYLTFIDLEIDGDTFFPEWDKQKWQQVSIEDHSSDSKNPYAYQFAEYTQTGIARALRE